MPLAPLSEKESRTPKNFVKKAFHPFKEQRIPILNNYSRAEEKTKKKKSISKKNPVPCFRKYSQLMGLNLRNQKLDGSMLGNYKDVYISKSQPHDY